MAIASFIVSLFALALSAWTRFEAFHVGQLQRRAELARRVGEAFLSGQHCKNTIDATIEAIEKRIEGADHATPAYIAAKELLDRCRADYDTLAIVLPEFEKTLIAFERGERPSLDAARIEAKIARTNQVKALLAFDVEFVASKAFGEMLQRDGQNPPTPPPAAPQKTAI